MTGEESDLRMVRRHIVLGQGHVRRQLRLIARLHRLGASTTLAEELLTLFEETLEAHKDHLRRINSASTR